MKLIVRDQPTYNKNPIQIKNKVPKLYISVTHLKTQVVPQDYNYNNLIQYPEMGPIMYAPFIFKMPAGHVNTDPNLVHIGYEHFQEFFDLKGRRHPSKALHNVLKGLASEGPIFRWFRLLLFKLGRNR
jgi:hypothetical protein